MKKWQLGGLCICLFILGMPCYSAFTNTPAGGAAYFPLTTHVEWVSPPTITCTNTYDNCAVGYQSGQLKVTYHITLGTAVAPINVFMNDGGAAVYSSFSTRGGSGTQFNLHSSLAQPGLTCTSADRGNFQTCLSRYAGSSFSIVATATTPFSNQAPTCTDVTIGPLPVYYPGGYLNDYWEFNMSSSLCTTGSSGVIPPPAVSMSVCSLNSQNLNFTYSSSSLNVNGLTDSKSLNVTCTSGDAKDYQLRLTGSNVTNGRLNFNNGVSAQVSLNGTQVNANGTGIALNGLTSRTIPVSATLVGTASGPGATTATGILVLDAL